MTPDAQTTEQVNPEKAVFYERFIARHQAHEGDYSVMVTVTVLTGKGEIQGRSETLYIDPSQEKGNAQVMAVASQAFDAVMRPERREDTSDFVTII